MKKQCIFAKAQLILYTLWLLVWLMSYPADCATYRLIDEHYLDVGNEWFYDMRITIQDNVSVDIPAAGSIEITGQKTVRGV